MRIKIETLEAGVLWDRFTEPSHAVKRSILRLSKSLFRPAIPAAKAMARGIRKGIVAVLACGAALHGAGHADAQHPRGRAAGHHPGPHHPAGPGHHPWPHHPGLVVPFVVQEWGPGWAVSAEGEYMKGMGAAYDGMGSLATGLANYRRQAAESDAIQTNAAIGLNEYLYRSMFNADLEREAHRLLNKEKRSLGQDAARIRIRYNPDNHDIESGDTLNALAGELTGRHAPPVGLRGPAIRLPDGLIRRVPLQLAQLGLVIAPQRLRTDGRWPTLLQDPAFARRCRAYEQAIEVLLEEGARGVLSRSAVAAVDASIRELHNGCETAAQTASPGDRVSAQIFLDRLSKSARMLHQPTSVGALTAVLSHSGSSVTDLLELMRRHRLRFAMAEWDDERAAYHELHPLLLGQAERLAANDPGPGLSPAPVRSEVGTGSAGERR